MKAILCKLIQKVSEQTAAALKSKNIKSNDGKLQTWVAGLSK